MYLIFIILHIVNKFLSKKRDVRRFFLESIIILHVIYMGKWTKMKIKFKLIDVLHDNAINGKDVMLSQLFVTPCIEYNFMFRTNLIDDKERLESKEISPLRLFSGDFFLWLNERNKKMLTTSNKFQGDLWAWKLYTFRVWQKNFIMLCDKKF